MEAAQGPGGLQREENWGETGERREDARRWENGNQRVPKIFILVTSFRAQSVLSMARRRGGEKFYFPQLRDQKASASAYRVKIQ